ncbi:MAG: hypothetical protein JWL90_38 [Chthoniobacteraceae bacterium]|nr:hypothetical protein [Chthoniobacteraceae bacterium]
MPVILADRIDPRFSADFDASLLPICDGGSLPSSFSVDPNDRLIIEFAAAYYLMNKALRLAEAARRARDQEAELAALRDLRSASHARDALEDRCAPTGFFAEPVFENDRYVELHFMWAGKRARPLVHVRRFEAEFTF